MITILATLPWQTIGLRVGVVAGALVIWFWTQALIGRKVAAKDGLGDVVHDLTVRWHRYLAASPRATNASLIVSSLFIDLFGLALIGAAIFGHTFAPFLSIIILFSMRQICQSLCTLPPPPGNLWRDPGFPSLLVTYGVSNDLFFSGHTGLAVLGAIHAAHSGPAWLAIATAVIVLGEALIVLVLRAHYTLDVIAGAFAAFLAAEIAGMLAPSLDAWLR